MSFSYRSDNARLSWREDGMPFATDYGDIYYSQADALGESSHVFLEGNALPARFAALQQEHFVIGELGFGAGLNFLNCCRLWSRLAPTQAVLHYVACELHPFRRADLQRLLAQFPELAEAASALLAQYPDHTRGSHQLQLQLGNHRIVLTLLYEDATAAFASLGNCRIDAWFLDGFAPKTNPAMWGTALLQQLARLSHADTTLASYSVAGSFRRALEAAGFRAEKAKGYTGKRHMLQARPQQAPTLKPRRSRGLACIIGGGLAGCSTAHALARAGWQVELIEQAPQLAAGASGNPQGILHFKPATVDSADNRFNLYAYLYAARHYRALELPEQIWSACGMLQLAHDAKLQKRFAALQQSGLYAPELLQILDAAAASELTGLPLQSPALYCPDAGWLSPAQLCEWYVSHPGIRVLTAHCVTQLDQGAEGWEVLMHGSHGERFLHASHVILCNSAEAWRFAQAQQLPLITNRGQVDLYAPADAQTLDTVVCSQGYLIPAGPQGQAVGGSFFLGSDAAATLERNRLQHLGQLETIHPTLAAHFAERRPLQQRVAERCTLPGRMPAVGLLAGDAEHGLWSNVGHGAQGLARTPVCAALLASALSGTPAPLSTELCALLDPRRFG